LIDIIFFKAIYSEKREEETFLKTITQSVAVWLRTLISNHMSLTAVGSNSDRDFGFFHVRKLSS
jgi:hypothetical protein